MSRHQGLGPADGPGRPPSPTRRIQTQRKDRYQLPDFDRGELLEYLGLVGVTEIADRAGVAVNTVTTWQRRHDDFPEPVLELAQGKIWAWSDVEPWIERQKAKGPGRPKG